MLGLFRKYTGGDLASPWIDMSLPLDKAPYVVIDTELTGLDFRKDSIVSVGALRMTGTRIEVSRPFYEVVRPSTEMTSKSIIIHEITHSETEQKTGIEGIMEGFLRFCEGAMIVGHFISLDLRFLAKEMKRIGFGSLTSSQTWMLPSLTNTTSIVPMGKGGTLGDGIAVDKLSVGSDKWVAVETTSTCTGRHADIERDRRQPEMRTCLKNDLDRIGHLCNIVICRLFIIIVYTTVIDSIKFQ